MRQNEHDIVSRARGNAVDPRFLSSHLPRRISAAVLSILVSLLLASEMALTGSGQSAGRPATPLEVGRAFPAITLPDIADGRPRAIADFRGRKIILHVFASW